MRPIATVLALALLLAAFPAFGWVLYAASGTELGALEQTACFALVLAAATLSLAGALRALAGETRRAGPPLLVAAALYLCVYAVPLALVE